jgi:hypothetical protein
MTARSPATDDDASLGPTPEQLSEQLSVGVIDALKALGMNQTEIGRQFNRTRQAVSWHKQRYGGRLTPRETILREHFPFRVSARLGQCAPYKRLRDHAEFMATDGAGMSDDKLKRLAAFYRKLRAYVVEFDPALPPEPGVSNVGGWAYRRRTVTDSDLLIRVNQHTYLTEMGRVIWRMPRPGGDPR